MLSFLEQFFFLFQKGVDTRGPFQLKLIDYREPAKVT